MMHRSLYGWIGLLLTTATLATPLTIVILPDSTYNKIGVPLIEELYRQVGVDIETLAIPASRQALMLSQQAVDAIIVYPQGLEQTHGEFIRLPVPITAVRLSLFTGRDDLDWPLPAGLTLGVLRGIVASDARAMLPDDLTLVAVNNPSQMMRMVDRQRLDLVLLPYTEGLGLIGDNGLTEARPLGPVLAEVPVYHYLHQRHQHLVEPLTAVLEDLAASGYLDDIHRNFRLELESAL